VDDPVERMLGRRAITVLAGIIGVVVAVVSGLHAAGDRRRCTLIGSEPSSVSVRLEGRDSTLAELCVDDRCEAADRVGVSSEVGIHIFRTSVVGSDGRTTHHSGEVTTVEVWPNGEGCGSRRAYATISIDGVGTVTTVDPWPVGPR